MFDPCCETIVGGEIYIIATFPTQATGPGGAAGAANTAMYEAMGDVRIQPAGIERTAGVSSAGSLWVTEAARPVRALLTFLNRCTPNPMRLFCAKCKVTITIVEKSRGITHQFTDAVIVGNPEVNLTNGQISGIEIVCKGSLYTVSSDKLGEDNDWCRNNSNIYSYTATDTSVDQISPQ